MFESAATSDAQSYRMRMSFIFLKAYPHISDSKITRALEVDWWIAKAGLCDHHPSHRHRGPCQQIAPCPEAEPVPVTCSCIVAVRGWIISGVTRSPKEPVCHGCGHLLVSEGLRQLQGVLGWHGCDAEKTASP